MSTVSTFQTYTLSLFQTRTAADAGESASAADTIAQIIAQKTGTTGTASSGVGTISTAKTETEAEDTERPLQLDEQQIALQKRHEAQGEEKRRLGYNPRVTETAINTYSLAISGNFSNAPLSSREDAVDFLQQHYYQMTNEASRYVSGTKELASANAASFNGDAEHDAQITRDRGRSADQIQASPMEMVVRQEVLRKSFGFSGDLFTIEDGTVTFAEMDFTFGGQKIAHMSTDGKLTLLNANGTPVTTIDKQV